MVVLDFYIHAFRMLLQDQPHSVDRVLKPVTDMMSRDDHLEKGGDQQESLQQNENTLAERRRYLREHTSFAAARTQGMTPVADTISLPIKAAAYGRSEEHSSELQPLM